MIFMKILLKVLNYFFVTLGVLFFILILIGVYLFMADPFGVKPLLGNLGISPGAAVNIITGKQTAPATATSPTTTKTTTKNPLITPEQEKTLQSMGIDTAKLPTEITPALEDCFTQKLGAQRTAEIKQGSAITPVDFLKASSCVK